MLEVMLSSDSHIIEPPDLWTSRLPGELRERGPQVRRVAPTPGLRSEDQAEVDYWFVDGERSNSPFAQVKHPGLRFEVERPWDIAMETTADSLRDDTGGAALAPADYVAHNRRDHVAGQVLFPTYALVLFALEDSALLDAVFRAYNDHAAEFCAHDPRRLKAAAAINVDDPAVAEMKRVRGLGLTAALIPVEPMPGKPYSSPEYEPIWSAAEDLDMPLCLHVGTNRFSAVRNIMQITQASRPNTDVYVRDSLAEMIFGGVFERHPRLRAGSAAPCPATSGAATASPASRRTPP